MLFDDLLNLSISKFSRRFHCRISAGTRKLRKLINLLNPFTKLLAFFKIKLDEIDRSIDSQVSALRWAELSKNTDRFTATLNISRDDKTITLTLHKLDLLIWHQRLNSRLGIKGINSALTASLDRPGARTALTTQ